MPQADGPDDSRKLAGIYQDLLDRERASVDPRLTYDKPPPERRDAPPARPARLALLECGDPILLPHWWIGGNHYPEAARWSNYRDRDGVRGWQVSADDVVVPVGYEDPRWGES